MSVRVHIVIGPLSPRCGKTFATVCENIFHGGLWIKQFFVAAIRSCPELVVAQKLDC